VFALRIADCFSARCRAQHRGDRQQQQHADDVAAEYVRRPVRADDHPPDTHQEDPDEAGPLKCSFEPHVQGAPSERNEEQSDDQGSAEHVT